MLIWKKDERRDNQQKIVSTSYLASVPYLGRISVHPHIHAPGEWFLTCQSLDIDRHPLGSVAPEEAERLAETELVNRLERHILWCRNALTEIHGKSKI